MTRAYPLSTIDFAAAPAALAAWWPAVRAAAAQDGTLAQHEVLALLDALLQSDAAGQFQYFVKQQSPVDRLQHEFLQWLAPRHAISNKFFQRLADQWQGQVPLNAVAVANATSGLFIALQANHVAGGEVIVPSLNYPAMPNTVLMAGAVPHFVELDPDTLMLDAAAVQRALNPRTRAIVFVHMNQFGDLEPLHRVLAADGRDLPVIQDASLALGSVRHRVPLGVFNLGSGGSTVFSFAATKTLTGLGGGMIVTPTTALAERMTTLACHGLRTAGALEVEEVGTNFRMPDLTALLVRVQLQRSSELMARRRAIHTWYLDALSGVPDVVVPRVDDDAVMGHFVIRCARRDAITLPLQQRFGVETGLWPAHHLQPLYAAYPGAGCGALPITEQLAQEFMFLPFHSRLQQDDVVAICAAVAEVLRA